MSRYRFAPSPTGFVHVGNLRTALFNFLLSKQNDNKMVLRIEDTDEERSTREYEEGLIRDLKWAGINWDEGPDKGGEFAPYRQSERKEIYGEYAKKLIDSGNAYYCFCTKEELEGEEHKNGYSGKCRNLNIDESVQRVENGENAALRFKIPENDTVIIYDIVRDKVEFDTNLLSDPIIVRTSGVPAYNFSVVVDDYLMKIDVVIRGEDHLSNTARQVLIYKAFGIKPPKFAHLSMVMGEDNAKLSKRHGSVSVSEFKQNGYLPQALFNYLALLGWSPKGDNEIFTKDELIKAFSLKRVSKSAAIFDYKKLKWFNREHIRLLSSKELYDFLSPFLKLEGIKLEESEEVVEWIGKTAKVLLNYHQVLNKIANAFKQFSNLEIDKEHLKFTNSEDAKKVIKTFYEKIKCLDSPVSFDEVGKITKEIQNELNVKGKALYHPIRVALTGEDSGIELHDLIPIIEIGSTLNIEPKILNMKKRLKRLEF